jgi:anti-anti-sigma regulatory factor
LPSPALRIRIGCIGDAHYITPSGRGCIDFHSRRDPAYISTEQKLISRIRKMVNDSIMSSFSVKTQLCSQVLIISAGGYLNRTGGEAIAKAAALPQYASIRKIILVVKEVQAANTVGIAYLFELLEDLKIRQGGFALVQANKSLLKTFSIMGLFTYAFKADSVREALELLS